MINGEDHCGARERAEHAVEVEFVHVPLIEEQPTTDKRARNSENDVAEIVCGFELHDLAGDEARKDSGDEPADDRQSFALQLRAEPAGCFRHWTARRSRRAV